MLRPISLEAARFLLCPFTVKGFAIYKYFYHNDKLYLLNTYVDGPNVAFTINRHEFEQFHTNLRTQFYRFEPVPQYVQDAVECGIELVRGLINVQNRTADAPVNSQAQ